MTRGEYVNLIANLMVGIVIGGGIVLCLWWIRRAIRYLLSAIDSHRQGLQGGFFFKPPRHDMSDGAAFLWMLLITLIFLIVSLYFVLPEHLPGVQ